MKKSGGIVVLVALLVQSCTSQDEPLSILNILNSQIDFLKQVCFERTQNTSIFEEIRSTLTECQKSILNGTTLNYASLSVVSPTEYHELYDGQCHDLEVIEERNDCNDQLKYLLKQCLNETEVLAFEKVENIALKLNSIICEIDADKIKTFFTLDGIECLLDNYLTIGFCFLNALPDADEDRHKFLFSLIEGNECHVIKEVERCVLTELKLCQELTPSTVFEMVFDFFNREMSCPIEDRSIITEIHTNHINTNSSNKLLPMLTIPIIAFLFQFVGKLV